MKHNIKKIWYFIIWLIADIRKNISFWPIYLTLIGTSIPAMSMTDKETSKLIAAFMLLSILLIAFSYMILWCIINPIKYKYEQYKQEQRDLLNTIKGD